MDFQDMVEWLLEGFGIRPTSHIIFDLKKLTREATFQDTYYFWNEKDYPNREPDLELDGVKFIRESK